MESPDIFEDICVCLSSDSILATIYSLPFEQTKEALCCRIYRHNTDSAHAANQIVSLKETLILLIGKLTAELKRELLENPVFIAEVKDELKRQLLGL